MLASRNGQIEALALLLANGANVNAAMQVIQSLLTKSHEYESVTAQNLSARLTRFAFESRMGVLVLCLLQKMGTLRLLRFYLPTGRS
jgi:hypothetical protein